MKKTLLFFSLIIFVSCILSLIALKAHSQELDHKRLSGVITNDPGITGIRFLQDDYFRFVICEIFPNSPALNAGLKSGDEIIGIDFIKPKITDNIQALSNTITGQPGTIVALTIKRGNQSYTAKIMRKDAHDFLTSKELETFYGQ